MVSTIDSKKHILIIAGGTGGHVFPGLSVAECLLKQQQRVSWLGSAGRLEEKLVPRHNIPFFMLPSYRLRGEGLLNKLLLPFKLVVSILRVFFLLQKIKPDLVLTMGGYVTVPGGIAAWLNRTPVLIHEQNTMMGLSNKLLSRLAKQQLVAFPDTVGANAQAQVVGNPVRDTIKRNQRQITNNKLNLLILGGSLGALALNRMLPDTFDSKILAEKYHVWHQTGDACCAKTQQAYGQTSVLAKVEAFINDMAAAYQWADVVICRAGALTIAELQQAALPAILVPYPYATDNHQVHNANYLLQKQAAMVLSEDRLSIAELQKILLSVASNPIDLQNMKQQLLQLPLNNATAMITNYCLEAIRARS